VPAACTLTTCSPAPVIHAVGFVGLFIANVYVCPVCRVIAGAAGGLLAADCCAAASLAVMPHKTKPETTEPAIVQRKPLAPEDSPGSAAGALVVGCGAGIDQQVVQVEGALTLS
jgi:hypothetical protein